MKTKLVAGLLFFSSLAFAAGPSVTVTVLDQELGSPLEGVRLQIAGSPILVTGPDGVAVLPLPSSADRLLLVAQLPGYETKKTAIAPGDKNLVVKMLLSGVVEGHELVVERPKPQKTDAQAGVSETLSKQDLTNTAKIGIVEDALSSVKTLPGVGYTSFIGGRPSIRGGDPNETTATLDGAYVLYPYHWGGAFSIFNPDMVDSVKLNDGIVSARYGQTLSALLEVNSITPDSDQTHWDLGMSTIGTDFFLQTPLTNNAALILGGKITDLSYILNAVGAGGVFSQAPYIKEGFGKLTWNPSPSLKTFINAYWGVDGVGVANDSIDKDITTKQKFAYDNNEVLVSGGAKILLDDNNLLDFLVSFNRWDFNLNGHTVTNGTKPFDSDFIARYPTLPATFTLNNLTNDFSQDKTEYLYQAKASWDWQASPGQVFSFGQESLLQFWTSDLNLDSYQIQPGQVPGSFLYLPVVLNTKTDGQKTATEGLYALYDFTVVPGTLTGEAGLRVDDSVVFNDQMSLQTQPAVNPRLLLTYTPVKDWNFVRSFSILGGTGLYSQFPSDNQYLDKKYGVTDYSIGPERAWFNELGTEVLTQDDWKIDLTGYWKSYFGRFYATFASPSTYTLHSDGTGYAYGFDVYFQKHTRYWDTSLAYSFIVSRLYNPGTAGDTTANGDPLGTWYYPDYQRFHNVSFVATVNPTDGFSITTEAQVASGTPLQKVGPATSFEAQTKDGTMVEMFSRTSTYDDNLRIGWSYPVSVKFSWHDFYTGSKIRWEFYLGVQDIFAMLYTKGIQGNPPIDQWYGSDLSGTSGASFSSGIPIPSVGFNMGY